MFIGLSVVVGGFVTFVCFWVGGCLACVGLLSVCVCDLLIVEWFSGVYAVVTGLWFVIVCWYRYWLRFVDLMLIVLVCLSGCYELYCVFAWWFNFSCWVLVY